MRRIYRLSRVGPRWLTEAVLEQAEIESALRQYAEAYQKMNARTIAAYSGRGPVKISCSRKPSAKKRNWHEAQKHKVRGRARKAQALGLTGDPTRDFDLNLYDAQTRSRDGAHGKQGRLLESFSLSGVDATQEPGRSGTL